MKKIILLFFAISFFSACKEKSTIEADVIAIHDEVMPKMGALHVAKKELKKILEVTEEESVKTEISKMISNLENADEGMMEWMHKWKVPENDPEKTAYLQKEIDKITKVKLDMLNSLEAANNYVAKSNKK